MSAPARTDRPSPEELGDFYDARYTRGYMQGFTDLYEACRVVTVRHALAELATRPPARVFDYGCGEGRYLKIVQAAFPHTRLSGGDVSSTALEHASRRLPGANYVHMSDENVPLPGAGFDLVVSIEVLEHVGDVERATRELGRLLHPGGRLILTTPCANPGSLEWLGNRRHGGLQATPDGYGRFATDEPGHLRRLTSRDLRVLLARAGIRTDRIDYRAHLFTPLAKRLPRGVPRPLRQQLAMLDWYLLRRVPAAATMLVSGTRLDV